MKDYNKKVSVSFIILNYRCCKFAATPRRWYCLSVVLSSESMSRSMRHQV
ncbi:MAG: hypothetical protein IJV23_00830 [Prevotella sp.]|nr:hypothetical protein [Prevotella sp.]